MINMSQRIRIITEAKCSLGFDGFDVQGMIENLSLSGALVKLSDKTPGSIRPGDKCDLMFSSDQSLYPVKYTSKVVRIDLDIIGIEFLELNMM